jgi:hypothetical protein
MLEADAGGMAAETEPYRQQFVSFVAAQQTAVEEQSGKLVCDMEMCMKRRCH